MAPPWLLECHRREPDGTNISDVFRELATAAPDARPVLTLAQRALVARRVLTRTPLNGLGRSARFAGFADALLAVLSELESGLLDPADLDCDLALLYTAYREELDRLSLWDRDLLRRRAVERLRSELEAWNGRPVFAYGFEDLTGAEWGLLEALSAPDGGDRVDAVRARL
jgi:hypothetical protein